MINMIFPVTEIRRSDTEKNCGSLCLLHLLYWLIPTLEQMVSALEEWSETVCDHIVCGRESSCFYLETSVVHW